MKSLKISQKDMKLLLILLALLILGGTYQFVYVRKMKQLTVVEEENVQLYNRLIDLRAKESKRAEVETENEKMSREINQNIEVYGRGATNEKSILYVRSLEEDTGMEIRTVSFMEPEYFLSPSEKYVEDNNFYHINAMNGYKSTVLLSFRVNYAGLKNSIKYITKHIEKSNIGEITVSYDSETGNLGGTLSIQTYHLLGENRPYIEPIIGGIEIGTDNIFGTIELPLTKNVLSENANEGN